MKLDLVVINAYAWAGEVVSRAGLGIVITTHVVDVVVIVMTISISLISLVTLVIMSTTTMTTIIIAFTVLLSL